METALSDTYLSYDGCLYPDSEVPRWTWWRESAATALIWVAMLTILLNLPRDDDWSCPAVRKTSFRQKCHMRDPFVENEGNVGEEEVLMGWEMDCFGDILSPIFSILVWFLGLQRFPRQFQLWIKNNNSLTEGFKNVWMLQTCHPPRKQALWDHGWGVGAETGRPSWGWIQVGLF